MLHNFACTATLGFIADTIVWSSLTVIIMPLHRCSDWHLCGKNWTNWLIYREGYGREEGQQDEGKILGLFDDDSFRWWSFYHHDRAMTITKKTRHWPKISQQKPWETSHTIKASHGLGFCWVHICSQLESKLAIVKNNYPTLSNTWPDDNFGLFF